MANPDLHVIGIGNAIVDIIANADDEFLKRHDIIKGGMTLIDETAAHGIYEAMAPGVEISGGSAANSIACVSSLGGKGGFIGKVSDDALGEIFRHDLRSIDVEFDTAPLVDGPATGRCLINVTPDAQRSMSTFLGAAGFVGKDDVDPGFIGRGEIVFLEGYLFETEIPRQAFVKASEAARAAGRRTALTLSDYGCVERNHQDFLDFIPSHIDVLVANQAEAETLFGVSDEEKLVAAAQELCPLMAITMSEHGSLLIKRGEAPVKVEAMTPTALVDTTGAGDAYAAGLLYGLANQMPLATAGALGTMAATEVISHFGARPQRNLREMARELDIL